MKSNIFTTVNDPHFPFVIVIYWDWMFQQVLTTSLSNGKEVQSEVEVHPTQDYHYILRFDRLHPTWMTGLVLILMKN